MHKLAALTAAVHADDRQALHHSLIELGMVQEDKPFGARNNWYRLERRFAESPSEPLASATQAP